MKEPTLTRRKRNGKYYGSWLAHVDGEQVNLGTKSAAIARQLLPEALKGRRNFKTDAQAVAEDLDELSGAGGAGATEGGTENQVQPGAQTASIPPPPPPPAPPSPPPHAQPAQAQAAQETPEEAARAEAEATNAAAAETSSATSTSSPAPSNDNGVKLDPTAIRGLLAVGAEAMVELQLGLQAWVIKRKTGKEPGLIPADAAMRKIAVECWSAQFVRWFPDLDDVPPWILALGVVGACAPYQLATAKPIPKENAENTGETPEQVAA